MSTEIATKPTVPPDQYAIVRENYARGCSESEWQVFLAYCNRYGLDPFAHQVWAVPGFGNKPAQIIVARDGYLAIAHRSGQFDGMGAPEYTYDDKGKLISVRVTVYRKDMTHPFVGDAWEDEDNLHQSVWVKRPRTMLLKVAESRALRKAFSISGSYCPEELGYEGAPYKVDRKPTDIDVNPSPVPEKIPGPAQSAPASAPKTEPVANVQRPRPTNLYTADQVAMQILPTYQQQGWDTSIFEKAKLPDGFYDKDMIMEDYKIQMDIPNSEVPPMKKAPAPVPTSAPKQTAQSAAEGVCSVCGKKMTKGELSKWKLFNDDKPPVCSDCVSKEQ